MQVDSQICQQSLHLRWETHQPQAQQPGSQGQPSPQHKRSAQQCPLSATVLAICASCEATEHRRICTRGRKDVAPDLQGASRMGRKPSKAPDGWEGGITHLAQDVLWQQLAQAAQHVQRGVGVIIGGHLTHATLHVVPGVRLAVVGDGLHQAPAAAQLRGRLGVHDHLPQQAQDAAGHGPLPPRTHTRAAEGSSRAPQPDTTAARCRCRCRCRPAGGGGELAAMCDMGAGRRQGMRQCAAWPGMTHGSCPLRPPAGRSETMQHRVLSRSLHSGARLLDPR